MIFEIAQVARLNFFFFFICDCLFPEALELISTAANHSNAAIRKMVRPETLSLLLPALGAHRSHLKTAKQLRASESEQTGSRRFLPRVSRQRLTNFESLARCLASWLVFFSQQLGLPVPSETNAAVLIVHRPVCTGGWGQKCLNNV